MFKNIQAFKKRIFGFSLVEMSVVLASVAAVVVMTAGGVTMIDKARLGNILKDVEKFSGAIGKFQEQYGSLPGDMADVSAIAGATAGNGNGTIDTAAEALGVWQHLSLSGLIEGKYDGASTFVVGVGVPTSDLDASGYNIKPASTVTAATLPSQAIVIELAGFSNIANNLPILTPEDAKAIDEKADDGNPRTGNILAEELVANDCVTVGLAYNLTNKSATCRLLFVVKSGKGSINAPAIGGTCTEIGQTRQTNDNTQNCPTGYAGKVIETCRVGSNNTGAWEITDRNCVEISCSDGGVYGQTRTLSCINGLTGTVGVTQTCGDAGVWKVTSSDCGFDTTKTCKIKDSRSKALACGWGQNGYAVQTCTNNSWAAPSPNNCANITCNGSNIGDARNSATSCGSDHTGTLREVCAISGTWQKTSVSSTCAPVYGSCSFGAADKDIGCPVGKTGTHILTCVDAATDYWTTKSDTCKPITCDGGENIGSSRVKEGAVCANGLNGTVMEFCNESGVWTETTTNCVTGLCDTTDDLRGNAYWPATVSGNVATATSCAEGYVQNSTLPTRSCTAGVWSSTITNPCIRKQCPASTINGAAYPATGAGEMDVAGVCLSDSSVSLLSDCSITGAWENQRLNCPAVFVGNPLVWLDASNTNTVFTDTACTTPATNGSRVRCWKDKSVNNFSAIQATDDDWRPTYSHNQMNGLPVMVFDPSSTVQKLSIADHNSLDIFGDMSILVVLNFDTVAGSGILGKTIGNVTAPYDLHAWSPPNRIWFYRGDTVSYGTSGSNGYLSSGTNYVVSIVMSGTTVNHFGNGTAQGSGTMSPTIAGNSNSLDIGSRNDNYTKMDGKIAELLLYDTALSTTDRQAIEQSLGNKWGIAVTP